MQTKLEKFIQDIGKIKRKRERGREREITKFSKSGTAK
jgi:hypothetical protein